VKGREKGMAKAANAASRASRLGKKELTLQSLEKMCPDQSVMTTGFDWKRQESTGLVRGQRKKKSKKLGRNVLVTFR